jgi:hypothetical protein
MQTALKILLAEDNPADAELVLRELQRNCPGSKWKRVSWPPSTRVLI